MNGKLGVAAPHERGARRSKLHARKLALAAVAISLMVAGPAAASPGNVVNGGFEEPDIATGSFTYFDSVPGWTAINGCGIEVQDRVAGAPQEGNQFVELNAKCKGGITQTITAFAGTGYVVSFEFSPRPGTQAEDNKVKVLWNGELMETVGPEPGGSATAWSPHHVAVTATGPKCGVGPNTLTFKSAGTNPSGGGVGAYLDDVHFTPTLSAFDRDCDSGTSGKGWG